MLSVIQAIAISTLIGVLVIGIATYKVIKEDNKISKERFK